MIREYVKEFLFTMLILIAIFISAIIATAILMSVAWLIIYAVYYFTGVFHIMKIGIAVLAITIIIVMVYLDVTTPCSNLRNKCDRWPDEG